MVKFRKVSTYEGNTVVLYLYGEFETDTKEAALGIMDNACMLTGPPIARIQPGNTTLNNTPTDKREGDMAHHTNVSTPTTAQGSITGGKKRKHINKTQPEGTPTAG